MTKSEAARHLFLSEAMVELLLRSGELTSLERPAIQRYRRTLRARLRKVLAERAHGPATHNG